MSLERQSLVLWVTGKCNLRCKYCYASEAPQSDMDFETAAKAIDLMRGAPITIQISGGEPLLNVTLIEKIFAYATERNIMDFAIQTNGTLIDDKTVELLKRYRVAIGVSLDGKPETNEYHRGGTNEVVDGIVLLREQSLMLNLNCVVSDFNAGRLREMVDMAVYFGNVRGIGFDLLRNAGRAAESDTQIACADAESLSEGLYALSDYLEKINQILPEKIVVREFEKARIQYGKKMDSRDYCYAAVGKSYVVLPDGDCYVCGSLIGESKYYMGNVHGEVQPLSIECNIPADCAKCKHGEYCTGGCPARAITSGGFNELDCVVRKISFEIAENSKRAKSF